MKLAEALQERSDLNRKIAQLRQRMKMNTLVQEGVTPAEDITQLKNDLYNALNRLAWIITRINLTNATIKVNGKTLTEMIAEKDMLIFQIAAYKDAVDNASNAYVRARGTEINIIPTISVRDWQKEIDRLSAKLRKIDNLLQETNWTTDLIE